MKIICKHLFGRVKSNAISKIKDCYANLIKYNAIQLNTIQWYTMQLKTFLALYYWTFIKEVLKSFQIIMSWPTLTVDHFNFDLIF